MNGREAVQALESAGFLVETTRGSHVTLAHPGTRRQITVPVHGARDIKPGTLRGIIRDAGLTVAQFHRLLK